MVEIAFSRFSDFGVDTLVETGTFEGDTTRRASAHFDTVYTIEKSDEYAVRARERFADDAGVEVIHGDAAAELADLAPTLSGDELYYLDAHFSDFSDADHVAGIDDQCPLLDELAAIADADAVGKVIIDDEFMFTKPVEPPYDPEHWPSLSEILDALEGISPDLRVYRVGTHLIALPRTESHLVRDILAERRRAFDRLSDRLQVQCALDSVSELGFVDPLRPKYHTDGSKDA